MSAPSLGLPLSGSRGGKVCSDGRAHAPHRRRLWLMRATRMCGVGYRGYAGCYPASVAPAAVPPEPPRQPPIVLLHMYNMFSISSANP